MRRSLFANEGLSHFKLRSLAASFLKETTMINAKLWSAVLIAATTLATPALAVGSNAASRHVRIDRRTEVVPREYYADRHGCILAPRVGAFATEPWTNGPPCEPNTFF
jgi:hypothetical protein